MKTFATDLSFSDLLLGVEGSTLSLQKMSQTIGQHISHSSGKKFLFETSFLGKFKQFFLALSI